MGKEFNPTNPQAPLKDGYIKKSAFIKEIVRDKITNKIIKCHAFYSDYAVNPEPNSYQFDAIGNTPIHALNNLLGKIESKICQVVMKEFGKQYQASLTDKNEHYIKFWKYICPEYTEYLEIKKLIESQIKKFIDNPID